MSDIHVVVGGQYGSEAKGNFTYNLARHLLDSDRPPFVVRTGGPNAGHSVVDASGVTWRLRMVPAGILADWRITGGLAEGCEIDSTVLADEIDMLESFGYEIRGRLNIDGQATLIESFHRERETALIGKIGSTGKGVGAARADRLMRSAGIWDPDGRRSVREIAANYLRFEGPVIIEATQGYGLGLHAGFYPKCTSRDVRGIDALAEVGISPWADYVDRVIIWVVYRTFPIRVAGDSGDMFQERSWEELGIAPEHTTVTKKVRRVGLWDPKLARVALEANGGPSINVRPVLMFWDYVNDRAKHLEEWADLTDEDLERLGEYEEDIGDEVQALGTSPSTVIFRGRML